ncbi:hypothetical protein ACH5RR_041050 [Cinchona calisaya]|uniref:Reverse transcriptase zinc-binding domain-containing protein n=1 Tax=Cinchona calisaya TaxID=153742 RepID=A0ABD2XXV6_9GENT
MDRISANPLFLSTEPDVIIWHPSVSGILSTSSAYDLVQIRKSQLHSRAYIWNAQIPLKVSIFLWKLLNRFLPFTDVLVELGFHQPSKCWSCNTFDDLDQTFLYSGVARHIWREFESMLGIPDFATLSIHQKFQVWWLHSTKLGVDQLCSILPTYICRHLWIAQNTAIHDNIFFSMNTILSRIRYSLIQCSLVRPFMNQRDGASPALSALSCRVLLKPRRSPLADVWIKPVEGSF